MAPDVQSILEQFQPYNRRDPTNDPLFLLNALCSIDKHRDVAFTGTVRSLGKIRLGPNSRGIRRRETFASVAENIGQLADDVRLGPFDDQTHISTFEIDVIGDDPYVDVESSFSVEIAFPEPGPAGGVPVAHVIQDIVNHIGKTVFPALKNYL